MVTYWLIILGVPQVLIKLIKLLLDHILTQNINILLINFLKYVYFCSIRLKYYQTNKQVKSFSDASREVNTTETWRVVLFTLNEMNPLLAERNPKNEGLSLFHFIMLLARIFIASQRI